MFSNSFHENLARAKTGSKCLTCALARITSVSGAASGAVPGTKNGYTEVTYKPVPWRETMPSAWGPARMYYKHSGRFSVGGLAVATATGTAGSLLLAYAYARSLVLITVRPRVAPGDCRLWRSDRGGNRLRPGVGQSPKSASGTGGARGSFRARALCQLGGVGGAGSGIPASKRQLDKARTAPGNTLACHGSHQSIWHVGAGRRLSGEWMGVMGILAGGGGSSDRPGLVHRILPSGIIVPSARPAVAGAAAGRAWCWPLRRIRHN